MREFLAFALAGCAFSLIVSTAPAKADWNSPHYDRRINGDWTNVDYSDGACRYSFRRNASDDETYVNRWGDCSHIVIGPQGEAFPAPSEVIVTAPR